MNLSDIYKIFSTKENIDKTDYVKMWNFNTKK